MTTIVDNLENQILRLVSRKVFWTFSEISNFIGGGVPQGHGDLYIFTENRAVHPL